MEKIMRFSDILKRLETRPHKARIAVVNPVDSCTQAAISDALAKGIAGFILIGSEGMRDKLPAELSMHQSVEVREIENSDIDRICWEGVSAVLGGEADVLMKGLVNTDNYLRAILNKEHGLLPKGNVLTHLSVAELPGYHKLLFFSDVAVIPYPNLEQKEAILKYDIASMRNLGIEQPRIALIHFTEKVNPKFPNSTDYVTLIKKSEEGAFGDVKMAGPMDVKTACDAHSAEVKGIASDVCGNADLLLFPNIESGNTFYKTITLFGGALIAGILQGAVCPIILPSRSDSHESKFASILLACACLQR